MNSPRKAQFGFKALLRERNLLPLAGWLRDNLPDPEAPNAGWWFTLNQGGELSIYTNEPLIAARLNELAS